MAATKLSSKAVGSIVKIKINGTLRDFIVVNQGKPSSLYDASCDGTWLLMKDLYETRAWHSSNVNDYANSTIHSYLNSTWYNLIDANIRNQIKQVKIPYRPGSGTSMTVSSGANGLSAKVFLLSNIEMGGQTDWSYMPHDGAKLAYFEYGTGSSANNKRIAYLNGTATGWWSRSPRAYDSARVWCGQHRRRKQPGGLRAGAEHQRRQLLVQRLQGQRPDHHQHRPLWHGERDVPGTGL